MNMELMVIFSGAMLALCCAGVAVQATTGGTQRRLHKRVVAMQNRRGGGKSKAVIGSRAETSLRRVETRSLPVLEKAVRRLLPDQKMLRVRLERTGRDIPVGTYVGACIAVGAVVGVLKLALFGMPPAIAILAGLAAGVGLPHAFVGRLAAKRLKKFAAVFPDAIDLMVRGLKSGLPVSESINAVGREMVDPVGIEFRRIADAIRFGQTMEDALWDAARRLDTPEFKFFVISLSVQRETGGNLGETLANLSDILRRRRQMRLKIKAMSSEARASALILGALPFLMLGLLMMLNFEYEMTLFTDPRGLMMVGAGLGILLIGFAVMAKMVRFEI